MASTFLERGESKLQKQRNKGFCMVCVVSGDVMKLGILTGMDLL